MYRHRRYGCLQIIRLAGLQKDSISRKKESLLELKVQSENNLTEMWMRTRQVCAVESHEQQGNEILSYDLKTTCTDSKTVKLMTSVLSALVSAPWDTYSESDINDGCSK